MIVFVYNVSLKLINEIFMFLKRWWVMPLNTSLLFKSYVLYGSYFETTFYFIPYLILNELGYLNLNFVD